MEIFGLDPILAAILITITGVSLSVILGWLKSDKSFNVKQVVSSAIIAFIVSAQLVIAQISIIPEGTETLALGALLIGMIAVVSGIDSLAKSGMSAALKARNGK